MAKKSKLRINARNAGCDVSVRPFARRTNSKGRGKQMWRLERAFDVQNSVCFVTKK